MKLYIQNLGWQGDIVVIAKDEENARKLMTQFWTYDPKAKVQEEEIREGFTYCNVGDA